MFKNNFNQKKKKNRSLIAITTLNNKSRQIVIVRSPQQPDVRIVKSIGAFILHCTLENAISIRNRRRVLKRPASCRFPRWKSWWTVIVAGKKNANGTSRRTDAPSFIYVSFPANSHRIFAMCRAITNEIFSFEKKGRTNGSGKINAIEILDGIYSHKSRV